LGCQTRAFRLNLERSPFPIPQRIKSFKDDLKSHSYHKAITQVELLKDMPMCVLGLSGTSKTANGLNIGSEVNPTRDLGRKSLQGVSMVDPTAKRETQKRLLK
jgi:hypothetical protein